jgi:hypothetical protein
MIKFVIKLAIVALIANAGWRVGSAYLAFYRFEDAIRSMVQYRGQKTDTEIRTRILDKAAEDGIPLAPESLTLERENTRTIVNGAYEQPVEVVPGYTRTFPFTIHLDIPTASLP